MLDTYQILLMESQRQYDNLAAMADSARLQGYDIADPAIAAAILEQSDCKLECLLPAERHRVRDLLGI